MSDRESSDEEVYEVEQIQDHRYNNSKKVLYLFTFIFLLFSILISASWAHVLLLCRFEQGSVEYLIKWKNYDEDSNTWEDEGNIYSPELLKAYWDDQAETRDEFIERTAKKLKTKRGAIKVKSTGKSSKPISVETDDSDDETGAAVDTEPPEGYAWRNAISIENIYGDETDALYAEVNWPKGQVTVCPTALLRLHNPQLLLTYYEKHIQFKLMEKEK
ncbi:hypothetical protein BCR43DRAFT_30208 [Syncephalastrum racemosum]|uniref:Chromo domain-containing protein n=1 Tax=Syncephalastrum racemosum TaxID=13706 RepID=A0A1X2HTX3_SYNRA|nr:hypothetical protein BCR43DRAFT_30208 [Syncephalastrum racemosum]